MHLTREADRANVGGFELRFFHDGADSLDGRLPPIFGVLLAPERLGVVRRIKLGSVGKDLSGFVDCERFRARGADIDPQENRHGSLRFV